MGFQCGSKITIQRPLLAERSLEILRLRPRKKPVVVFPFLGVFAGVFGSNRIGGDFSIPPKPITLYPCGSHSHQARNRCHKVDIHASACFDRPR